MQLLLLTKDLMTRSRIESTASALGITTKCVTTGEQLLAHANEASIIALDLSADFNTLVDCVQQLKSLNKTTPAILAFGPHVHEQHLQAMADVGCDGVFSRGQFLGQTGHILTRYLRP